MRHSNFSRGESDRRAGGPAGAIALCALTVSLTCWGLAAADEPRARSGDPAGAGPAPEQREPAGLGNPLAARRGGERPRLERGPVDQLERYGKLHRRVDFELSSLDAMRQVAGPGHVAQDHVLYRTMVERVEHGVEKATRRAVGEYLLDSSGLNDVVERWKSRRARATASAHGDDVALRGLADRADFDLRVYRGLPLVEMRYDLARTVLRVRLGATGAVGFDLGDPTMEETKLTIGFDGDDTYSIGCRIGL